MSHLVTVAHIDTCTAGFVADHHNRPGELLLGVAIDGATRVHQVRAALVDAYRCDSREDGPAFDHVVDAIAGCFKGAHPLKVFDKSLDKLGPDASPDFSCYAWFLVTWPVADDGAAEVSPADQHYYYNRDNFPIFIVNTGNHDIYARADGYCASIPSAAGAAAGCQASHFGDAAYVRATLGVDAAAAIAAAAAPLASAEQQATPCQQQQANAGATSGPGLAGDIKMVPGPRHLYPAAELAVRRAFKGQRNFMTPNLVGYQVAGPWAVEVSWGEGFRNRDGSAGPRLYAVTVVTLDTWASDHALSRVVIDADAAALYIGRLADLAGYRKRRAHLLGMLHHVRGLIATGCYGSDERMTWQSDLAQLRRDNARTLSRFGLDAPEVPPAPPSPPVTRASMLREDAAAFERDGDTAQAAEVRAWADTAEAEDAATRADDLEPAHGVTFEAWQAARYAVPCLATAKALAEYAATDAFTGAEDAGGFVYPLGTRHGLAMYVTATPYGYEFDGPAYVVRAQTIETIERLLWLEWAGECIGDGLSELALARLRGARADTVNTAPLRLL